MGGGVRTLQSEQAPAVENFGCDRPRGGAWAGVPLSEFGLEPREVTVAAAGVGDDVKRVCGAFCDDSVIDDAAAPVEEHRKHKRGGLERDERRGREPFKELCSCRAAEAAARSTVSVIVYQRAHTLFLHLDDAAAAFDSLEMSVAVIADGKGVARVF